MSFLDTAKVNVFHGVTNKTPAAAITLAHGLDRIQGDDYRAVILQMRALLQEGNVAEYQRYKRRLTAFTFCGTFRPTRAKTHLRKHTGIVHGDLDHLDDLQAVKALLCADPHMVYAFVSPSGAGLKLGVRIAPVKDAASYTYAWQVVAADHQQRYGITWDASGKDVSRLCFASHDAELYRNPDAELFAVPPYVPPPPTPRPVRPAADVPIDVRERHAQRKIQNAVDLLDASSPGNRHAARLKAGELLGGCIAGGILSYGDAHAALAEAVARNTADVTRSMHTIAEALEHGQEHPITLDELEAEWHDWLERQRPHAQRPTPDLSAPPAPGSSNGTCPPEPPQYTAPPVETDPPLPWSDTTNALALVREHGHNLHYCWPWHTWLVWTGTHWQRDDTGTVRQYAKQTVKRLARQAEALDDQAARALMAHVKSSLATAKIKALIEGAQDEPGIPVLPDALDADPWLLNCANGTIDLKTGMVQPHQQADLLTKCLPLAYDPQALCPTWERFLWEIMGGTMTPDDPEMSLAELEARHAADARAQRLSTFLQRSIGYSLSGSTKEQSLFILHGSGANGKSTLLEGLQALLEDYAQSTPSASLLAKERHGHEGIPNDIARLRGARLVTAVEIGEGKRLNEELVKRLTGQDTMTARFLHAEFFDFVPEFKLFIACNHLPTIKGTDHAIWRRVKLIPFTVTIPDDEQDTDLPAKLKTELPGILRWAVQGCLSWQQDGLQTPDEVKVATQTYRASQDVIGRFIEECCLVSPQVQVKAGDLYHAYKQWCEDSGEYAVTLTAFGTRLEDQGFLKHKVGTIWRLGIGLQTTTEL